MDILVDFERGAINTIQNYFQNVEVKRCFYHFCSNVWKHIQQIGFRQRYNEDQGFVLYLRMLCALAFLLPNDIVQGFEDLVDLIKANHNNNVEDLLEYFEENYISRYRQNAPQHIAIIPIEL